jgi:hypothetical protein
MLVQQIDPTITVAIIGLIGAILSVGLPYVLTRNKEIDLSIRQEKTQRYDELIATVIALTGDVLRNEYEYNILTDFIKAYHRSSTYASDEVLAKCNELVNLLMQAPDIERIKICILNVYKAIRLDINPKAKYSGIALIWPTVEGSKEEVSKSSGPPIN